MLANFHSIHNHQEEGVKREVMALAVRHPGVAADPDLLADVACIALNQLPARYIRHAIDLSFYQTEQERAKIEAQMRAAVEKAFQFVESRLAERARA
jgi:Late competence development protein ComFB